jgi:hypothetical protein
MGTDDPITLGLAEKRFGAHRDAATIENSLLECKSKLLLA